MKTVFFLFALHISTTTFAGFTTNTCDEDPMQQNIIEIVSHQTPFSEFDLEGVVTIAFTLDDEGRIHIKGVSSGNIFLADHVISTLQNRQVNCDCAEPGVVYTMRLQYLQYS